MELTAKRLLLLDLDGVVVLEIAPPLVARRELMRLHDALGDLLQLGMKVVVLTHRSRREALTILEAAGLSPSQLSGVLAAEDLLIEGLRHGRFLQLARRGLAKDLCLPLLERRFAIPRQAMAMIDDRAVNLRGLLDAGLGMALLAPSSIDGSSASITTFSLASAVVRLQQWAAGERSERLTRLEEQVVAIKDLARTGMDASARGRHLFNRLRRVGFHLRSRLRALSSRRGNVAHADHDAER